MIYLLYMHSIYVISAHVCNNFFKNLLIKIKIMLNSELEEIACAQYENIDEFKSILDKIKRKFDKIEFNLNNGDYCIKEYCIELRTQVQLAKEIKMQQLEKLSDSMLDEIDDFEKVKLNEHLKRNKDEFQIKLNQLKKMIDEQQQNMNSLQIIQSKLANEQDSLNNFLFNGKVLEFSKRKEDLNASATFGQLAMSSFDSIDFNNLNKFDLNSYFDQFKSNTHMHIDYDDLQMLHFSIIDTLFLDNNDYVIFAKNKHEPKKMLVLLFDENKTTLKYSSTTLNATETRNVFTNSNKICFEYEFENKRYVGILNDKLELISNFKLSKHQNLIGVNDSFLFIGSLKNVVSFYDWLSFEHVKSIGQSNKSEDKFYFSETIFRFDLFNGKYYSVQFLNGEQCVVIMDEFNGTVLNMIRTEEIVLFHIDKCNNRLILVDEDFLRIFCPIGNILNEIKLINFPETEMAYWSMDSMNNLHVFDEENYWLSFKDNKFLF